MCLYYTEVEIKITWEKNKKEKYCEICLQVRDDKEILIIER